MGKDIIDGKDAANNIVEKFIQQFLRISKKNSTGIRIQRTIFIAEEKPFEMKSEAIIFESFRVTISK